MTKFHSDQRISTGHINGERNVTCSLFYASSPNTSTKNTNTHCQTSNISSNATSWFFFSGRRRTLERNFMRLGFWNRLRILNADVGPYLESKLCQGCQLPQRTLHLMPSTGAATGKTETHSPNITTWTHKPLCWHLIHAPTNHYPPYYSVDR